jgi:hypothetical protein
MAPVRPGAGGALVVRVTSSEPGPVSVTLAGMLRETCWPPSPETLNAARLGAGVG